MDVANPFPIPKFREHTQANLDNCKLAYDDIKYMVRVLATMLCTYVQWASQSHGEIVATSLVQHYPFLKEHVSFFV